jgi:hypothetical protein
MLRLCSAEIAKWTADLPYRQRCWLFLGWGRNRQLAEAVAAVGVVGGQGQGDLRRAGGVPTET